MCFEPRYARPSPWQLGPRKGNERRRYAGRVPAPPAADSPPRARGGSTTTGSQGPVTRCRWGVGLFPRWVPAPKRQPAERRRRRWSPVRPLCRHTSAVGPGHRHRCCQAAGGPPPAPPARPRRPAQTSPDSPRRTRDGRDGRKRPSRPPLLGCPPAPPPTTDREANAKPKRLTALRRRSLDALEPGSCHRPLRDSGPKPGQPAASGRSHPPRAGRPGGLR